MNIAGELFMPSGKHTEDERRRLTLMVDDAGDADPGKGPIDLSSGVVLIRPPRVPSPEEPDRPDPSR
ncbi:DUF6191 domain-containing protein [Streptomyces sp. NPDC003077]|uniref:DUF6191 domain-containing protein n=1 Tax=Streptomyces sp. NPDC003077 TaxID=3154443 RepID=UPI0033BA0C77